MGATDERGNAEERGVSLALRRAIAAFGPRSDLAMQLREVARCPDGFPQFVIAAAIHHYLRQPPEERQQMLLTYLTSLPHSPAETVDESEQRALAELELATYGRRADELPIGNG